MGKTVIKFDLSAKSINKARKALEKYQREFQKKCSLFVSKLADVGIEAGTIATSRDVGTPEENKGYGKYIVFRKDIQGIDANGKIIGIVYATNTGLIRSQWRTNNNATGIATADVSPILMAEFGAGFKARKDASKFGMGQGTFPGQTHAFDTEGWWYQTLDYEWHHSYGVTPTMPVQKAADEMVREIARVVREVWP